MDNSLWYKNAVFYEVYVRAFCDSNGDGHGDLPGLIAETGLPQGAGGRLHLAAADLPLAAPGRRLRHLRLLRHAAHLRHPGRFSKTWWRRCTRRGMRLIIDLVLNHTSDQHPWFQAGPPDPAARPTAITTSGATPTRNTRRPASSSWTPKNPTGPGTTAPGSISGTASIPSQPDLNLR